MSVDELLQATKTLLLDRAITPVSRFLLDMDAGERTVFYILTALAVVIGFTLGRRRVVRTHGGRPVGALRFPRFQNDGEELVTRVLQSHFGAPYYHLMNHVTLRMDDGTTQVDHILVSRFGVFVIETKDYNGWIFADASRATWTHVFHKQKYQFQNPVFQNYRHVVAVQQVLDFLPPEAIRSLVVFSGTGEFRTPVPDGVIMVDQLEEVLRSQNTPVMSLNRMQFCVGRLETARLAISGPDGRRTCPEPRPPTRHFCDHFAVVS